MTFEEYLIDKKIDSVQFKAHEKERWDEWSFLFSEIGANSFTEQKLYLINPLRRKYLLVQTAVTSVQPPRPKPVFKPKIS